MSVARLEKCGDVPPWLVAAHEAVEECNGTIFSVMPLVYLEAEHTETPPLFFGENY
jgi:hypothetical protein